MLKINLKPLSRLIYRRVIATIEVAAAFCQR
jgi:hypothetical protein